MAESIFPFIQPEPQSGADALPVLREPAWDFANDRPVFEQGEPVMVERAEAVVVWAWNALHTVRWRHEMYTPAYGCDIENMIGQGWSEDLKRAEARQYVEECLRACPYITAVTDIAITFENDKLSGSFAIQGVYGPVKMEV